MKLSISTMLISSISSHTGGAEYIPSVRSGTGSRMPTDTSLAGDIRNFFLQELEANERMRDAVRERSAAGVPFYAECGGLMYLTDRIVAQGRMAGEGEG